MNNNIHTEHFNTDIEIVEIKISNDYEFVDTQPSSHTLPW